MKPHADRLAGALADPNVASGLLEFQRSWAGARHDEMARLEELSGRSFADLRHDLADAKRSARRDAAAQVERFREHAEAAGVTVTVAADAAAANAAVARLCRDADTRVVVKTKSMLSEEICLNDALAAAGVTAVETDLGEWLLQLAGEHPSHLVLPAIHKRAPQIAQLLESVLGRPFDPTDIDAMVAVARTELRDAFLHAGVGVTGANALIAETGSVLLVTNEGNAGLTVALPPVRVVLAGVDKLVATMADAMDQVRLLARSATAQPITTYTQLLTGGLPGQAVHIILVDNGRSAMAADPAFEEALNCIRCGACSNVCPPYQVVGGHAFGHVYTGAIGLVVTPFHHGLEAAAGPQSLCVSCGACTTVCPVEIPLAEQILEVRHRVVQAEPPARVQQLSLRVLRSARATRTLSRAAALVTAPLRTADHERLRLPAIGRQLSWRAAPALPLASARRRLRARLDAPGDLDLFVQCVTDVALPEVADAVVEVATTLGHRVSVPAAQHCCGLPAFDSGDHETARRMAQATIEALDTGRPVVTGAASCAVMVVHEYPKLFADDPVWGPRATDLAARFTDFVSWVATHPERARLGVDGGLPPDAPTCTVHGFCQSQTVLGQGDEMEQLIGEHGGIVAPLTERAFCCGFGGSTSFAHPEVAQGIVERKLGCIADTGAPTVVTDNPGCQLHLRAAAARSGPDVDVRHIAEVLADRARPPTGGRGSLTGGRGSLTRPSGPSRPIGVSTTPWPQHDLTVLGNRLRYIDVGPTGADEEPVDPTDPTDPSDRAPGLPIVILPGHTSRLEGFDPLIPALSARHRVLVMDLPGTGYADKPVRRYTLAFYEETILGFLDAVGVDQAVLVGGSLGGNLTLRLGHRRPERFPRLVAWGPAGSWTAKPRQAAALRALGRKPLFWPTVWGQSRFWYGKDFPGRQAALDSTFAYYREVMSPGFIAMYFGIAADQVAHSLFDIAADIHQPVRLLVGELDNGAGMRAGVDHLHHLLPHSELSVYAGARHSIETEQPDRVAADILEFVHRSPAALP